MIAWRESGPNPAAALSRPLHSTRVTAILLWLMVGVDALFLVGLIDSAGRNSPVVTVWLSLATQWIPVTIFWLVVVRTNATRPALVLVAAAVTLSALGDTYYSFAMDSDGFLASPSPADAGYLLFYPLMVAALVVVARQRIAGSGWIVVLESAVATLGSAAVLAVVLDPVISIAGAGPNAWDGAVAVAYPLFDVLLLSMVVGIASMPSSAPGRRWWALIAGLAIFAAADVVYALLDHQGSYLGGSPLDASWAIGLGFITWWVVGSGREQPRQALAARVPFPIPVPSIAVLAGLAVLVSATRMEVSILAVTLAAITVGLACVPMVFRQRMLGRVIAAQQAAVARLTEVDRDKSDMMVTLNHEFRTPLASINGRVELLLDGEGGELTEGAMRMLRTIEDNGARLQDLVDDMLTVSRLEQAAGLGERSPRYIHGLVTRASATVAPQARHRNIEVTVECSNFSLVVDADGTHLERAFANLIDNAVKFSRQGGGVVITIASTLSGDYVSVVVKDDGIGIPPADLPRLFTRFFRADNVQQSATPGVGLGLPISRGVIEAHGGTIAVESVLDEGTEVTVLLPLSATGVTRSALPASS